MNDAISWNNDCNYAKVTYKKDGRTTFVTLPKEAMSTLGFKATEKLITVLDNGTTIEWHKDDGVSYGVVRSKNNSTHVLENALNMLGFERPSEPIQRSWRKVSDPPNGSSDLVWVITKSKNGLRDNECNQIPFIDRNDERTHWSYEKVPFDGEL